MPHSKQREEHAVELTKQEARQGNSPRIMLTVLLASLFLAVLAGLLLALGWIALPALPWS